MPNQDSTAGSPDRQPNRGIRRSWLLSAGVLVIACVFMLWHQPKPRKDGAALMDASASDPSAAAPAAPKSGRHGSAPRHWNLAPGVSAEEVVTNKVSQFARNRREVLHRMANYYKIEVPGRFEQFFDAAEAGQWDTMSALFESLKTNREDWAEDTRRLWPTINETYGVAEVAHDWPAQQLLNYGENILGSLRPEMVYVGGTDPGRFIPTLLNETSDGEHHVVLTQNALADSTYLDYVRFLYSDRLNSLKPEDSENSFKEYIADAQKRLLHDQQFPDEPKQLRPGEDVRIDDGRVQVSGQVAVMAINENLFQKIMARNPDASFAMEQSFALKSTYPEAVPLGPIMELRVTDPEQALTPERATQTVDYWSATTQQLLSDLAANDLSYVRKTWSKMASEQAALFLDHNYAAQAEEQFHYANQICPDNPEAVFGYVQFLMAHNRSSDAIPVAQNAVRAAANNVQFRDLLAQLQRGQGH